MHIQFLLFAVVVLLGAGTVQADLQPRDRIIVQTLIKLNRYDVSGNEKWKEAVLRYTASVRGTEEHLDLVSKFKVAEEYPFLVKSILENPQGAQATNGAKLLFNLDADHLFQDALENSKPEDSPKLLELLGLIKHPSSAKLLVQFITTTRSDELRKLAASSLMKIGNQEQKELAKKHAVSATISHTGKLDIGKLLKLKGDSKNGKLVYQKLCFACHVAEDVGIDYGPALSEIGDKLPKTELYTAIIDPSAGVSFNYEGWIFQMKDGTSSAGIIHSESDNEITLRMAGGLRQTYPKSEILSRQKMATSLMPAGLHLALKQEELVDLVEYLASLRKKQ